MLHSMGNLIKPMEIVTRGGWYNPMKLISYGRPWMFSTGARSIGKSTNFAALLILDYIYNGSKFFYVRRTDTEIQQTAKTYFDGVDFIICRALEDDFTIEYEGGEFFIKRGEEREQCGRAIALSKQRSLKSSRYPEYNNIIYDEFIVDNPDGVGYISNRGDTRAEYREVYSLYVTIDRAVDKPHRNEVRMFFLGNTSTAYNPIYLSIGAAQYVDEQARFIRPKNTAWIIEQSDIIPPDSEDSFAYMLADEREKDFTFKNYGDRALNSPEWIKKPNYLARYLYTIKMSGKRYSLRFGTDKALYIGNRIDENSRTIALDSADYRQSDLELVDNIRHHFIGKYIIDAYKRGGLFFENKTAKVDWLKYLKFTI